MKKRRENKKALELNIVLEGKQCGWSFPRKKENKKKEKKEKGCPVPEIRVGICVSHVVRSGASNAVVARHAENALKMTMRNYQSS